MKTTFILISVLVAFSCIAFINAEVNINHPLDQLFDKIGHPEWEFQQRLAATHKRDEFQERATTWNGAQVSDRFCGLDENNECHFQEYAEVLSKAIVPGIILMILSIIACPVFCCGRFVCNCFGGRSPNKGICCGKSEDFEGYSLVQIWVVKILLFLVMVAIGLSAILGYVGNAEADKGINTMTDTLINTGNTVVERATSIGNSLLTLPYTMDAGQSVLDAIETANETLNTARDVRDMIKQYNSYRSAALITSFALPLFLLVIGIVGAIFNFKWLAMAAAIFCFFCSTFIWLSFGIHNLVAEVFTDICMEIDIFFDSQDTSGNSTDIQSQALNSLLSCSDGGSFGEITDLANDALNQSYTLTCEAVNSICNDTRVGCSANYVGGNCSRNGLEMFLNETITDYVLGCNVSGVCFPWDGMTPCQVEPCFQTQRTVRDCATKCNNSQIRGYANEAVVNLNLLFTYTDLLNNQILPLLDCQFISDAFNALRDALCTSLRNGIKRIAISSAILGAFLVPGTILLILGFKRFRGNRGKGDEDYHDEEDNLEFKQIERGSSIQQNSYPPSYRDDDHSSKRSSVEIQHQSAHSSHVPSYHEQRSSHVPSYHEQRSSITLQNGNFQEMSEEEDVPPPPNYPPPEEKEEDDLYPELYPGQVEIDLRDRN